MSTLPRPHARISNWPLAEPAEDQTALWSPGEGGAPAQFPAMEDSEPTRRYAAVLVAPRPPSLPRARPRPRPAMAATHATYAEPQRTQAPIPSILPSLSPPAPRNPFDEPPLTGTGKVALMPPRGEPLTLGPIPPSPLVPDFRASSGGIPWGPVLLGLACALLGILGYNFIPRATPAVHLEIVSAPSGAQVRVDGDVQGTRTPLRLSGLEPGRGYRVAVELPGYQTWSTTHVPGNTSVQQIAVLKPILRTLTVSSQPEGADVYLNETLVGKTPVSLPSVQVATPLRLRVELAGHVPVQRELVIDPADPTPRVQLTLQPR
jgi:hypothetical protein